MTDDLKLERFKIAHLVELFRRALVVVGPLAEEAGVDWLQDPSYDDWDDATVGLFSSFVGSALLHSTIASQLGSFPRYGFSPDGYSAFLALPKAPNAAFLGFAGNDRELGSAYYREVGSKELVQLPWVSGEIRLRLPSGELVETIEVEY